AKTLLQAASLLPISQTDAATTLLQTPLQPGSAQTLLPGRAQRTKRAERAYFTLTSRSFAAPAHERKKSLDSSSAAVLAPVRMDCWRVGHFNSLGSAWPPTPAEVQGYMGGGGHLSSGAGGDPATALRISPARSRFTHARKTAQNVKDRYGEQAPLAV